MLPPTGELASKAELTRTPAGAFPDRGSTGIQASPVLTSQIHGAIGPSRSAQVQEFDREEVYTMPVSTRPAEAAEAPGRLQLAIREWQRQLIAMAEAAQSARATYSAAAGG